MRSGAPLGIAFLVIALVTGGCDRATVVSDEELDAAVGLLRPTFSDVEMDDFIEACLNENAVTSFERQPGGYGFSGQGVTLRDEEVMRDCVDTLFQEHPNPPQPKTDAEFMVLYRLYQQQADCLQSLGLSVDQPTFERYRDGGGEWAPYSDLPEPQATEWSTWNETCPQNPWEYDVSAISSD